MNSHADMNCNDRGCDDPTPGHASIRETADYALANAIVDVMETEIYYGYNLKASIIEFDAANPELNFAQNMMDFLKYSRSKREIPSK